MSDALGAFLQSQREGPKDSSGQFTLAPGRAGRLLANQALPDPALAVLKVVQAGVSSCARSIHFSSKPNQLVFSLVNPRLKEIPVNSPDAYLDSPHSAEFHLSLALWSIWSHGTESIEYQCSAGQRWVDLAPWLREEMPQVSPPLSGDAPLALTFRVTRRVQRSQCRREAQLLQELCMFCPVKLEIEGRPVQPVNLRFPQSAGGALLPPQFHLAEFYRADPGPGIAVLRDDGQPHKSPWVDTAQTLYREIPPDLPRLRWRYPVHVAGLVARHAFHHGWRCGGAAFLHPQSAGPSHSLAVHLGVVVGRPQLNSQLLPGVTLVFDASALPVDLSGLKLVEGEASEQALALWESLLIPWLQRFSKGMMAGLRRGQAFSWQTRRELKVALGIFGVSVGTGMAAFLPLTFLSLPWLVWYHGSRQRALRRLQERLEELPRSSKSEPL